MTAKKIIEIAKKEVGYKENKGNDNKYGKWYKMNNVPWCMIFVQWVVNQAGEGKKIVTTAGCEYFEAWAKRNDLIVAKNLVQEGDIVLFDFHKEGKSVHVGIALGYNKNTHLIDTVEGNTAGDSVGSQANGDGVYFKHRALTTVRYVVRPKWSTK
mgnify:CR=1 FL=1